LEAATRANAITYCWERSFRPHGGLQQKTGLRQIGLGQIGLGQIGFRQKGLIAGANRLLLILVEDVGLGFALDDALVHHHLGHIIQ